MVKQNTTKPQRTVDCGMWNRLGAALRRERDACGLTVREIERKSGVRYRTLYNYEHASNQGSIDLGKFVALCTVIGCDPCGLLKEAMEKPVESH